MGGTALAKGAEQDGRTSAAPPSPSPPDGRSATAGPLPGETPGQAPEPAPAPELGARRIRMVFFGLMLALLLAALE